MIRIAFSTVACPTWTLDRVASAAEEYGFAGVELRSFGEGGGEGCRFACEPGMTAGAKVRSIFDEVGVAIAGVGSGVRFDAPIVPPVLGNLLPAREASVREGKGMVQLASSIGAEYLRVYAFELPKRESRKSGLRRICERLYKVCDHARNRDLRVVIENGGSFAKAEDLAEIIERVNWPLLGACYDLDAAVAGEDDVAAGAALLGSRLMAARVRDRRDGKPCMLGMGELPVREFVESVRDTAAEWNTSPWMVFSWDRVWVDDLAPAESALPEAARKLAEWSAAPGQRLGVKPGLTPQSVAPAMIIR